MSLDKLEFPQFRGGVTYRIFRSLVGLNARFVVVAWSTCFFFCVCFFYIICLYKRQYIVTSPKAPLWTLISFWSLYSPNILQVSLYHVGVGCLSATSEISPTTQSFSPVKCENSSFNFFSLTPYAPWPTDVSTKAGTLPCRLGHLLLRLEIRISLQHFCKLLSFHAVSFLLWILHNYRQSSFLSLPHAHWVRTRKGST